MTIQQKWKIGIFPKNGQFFQKFFGNCFGSIDLEAQTWEEYKQV